MLTPTTDYNQLVNGFQWTIPEHYNIGVDVCERHARGDGRLALIFIEDDETVRRFSFDDIHRSSARFANVLRAHGVTEGDRVGVFLPQRPETAVAHVAVFKAGCISVPLYVQFGEEALEHRLSDSGSTAVVTDHAGLAKIEQIRDRLPALKHLFLTDVQLNDSVHHSFWGAIERASDAFTNVRTRAGAPAVLIYTSGTTGNPKGALLPHRSLIGHLPAIELAHDFFPQPGDRYWTPADWAWIGGFFDVLLPAWHHGVTVVASPPRKFDPEWVLHLMATHSVRNAFFPPTALKFLRQSNPRNPDVRLRSIFSGGEPLGAEMLEWARGAFGVTINELYGQTECNVVVGNSASLFPVRPGSMGRAVPGHDVRIVDEGGHELPPGTEGIVAVRSPDPVMFLEYWNNPAATREKFAGDFLLTGDRGIRDDEGYFWYVGRADDVITSAGYRIGPAEIENCIMAHPAVAMVAVVGVADALRTESIKAWVVPKAGVDQSEALARDIQAFVRRRLAAYECPRHVAFTDTLPMTVTGKVMRGVLRARG